MSAIIDCEELISQVYMKPVLWDKSHKFYNNRSHTYSSWSEISRQMNIDEAKLRKKWRYLRYQFAAELGKLPPYRPEDEATTDSKWPYFKSMLFLENIVTPRTSNPTSRRSPSPIAVIVKTENSSDESDIQSLHENDVLNSLENEVHDTRNTHHSKRLKLLTADRERNMQFSHEAITSKEDDVVEDEHMLFFRSLMPHVRKIAAHHLLRFRNQVQGLVDEYAYRSHTVKYP